MPPFWKRLKEKQPSADPKKDTGIHLSAKPDFPTVPNESVPGLSLRQTVSQISNPSGFRGGYRMKYTNS
jgi:hypothetical protein